jgi:hypothetical protein
VTARVWSVKVNNNALTDVDLVSVNLNIGQKYILEPLGSSSMTFTGRYPAGFASPNPDLVIGAVVALYEDSTKNVWAGRITDVSLELGVPFASGTGPADFVTVSAEGVLGTAGRTDVTTTSAMTIVGSNVSGPAYLQDAWRDAGVNLQNPFNLNGPTIDVSDREWNGLELIQALRNTYYFYIRERFEFGPPDGNRGDIHYASTYLDFASNTVNLSDTANNSTNQVFDQIMLDSLSDTYYTAAEFTQNTTSAVGRFEVGSPPYVLYSGESIARSTLDNQELAEVLANVYSTAAFDIMSISCLSEAQASWNLWLGNADPYNVIGRRSNVTFRGTTTNVIVIGLTITATPESSRFTFHCAPTRFFQFLTLDDATLGKLDENRLGLFTTF